MARPRAFDEDVALQRARDVFWTRGYEATSVRDLADALGITQSSLYAAFGDKRALYLRALDRYAADAATDTEAWAGSDRPALDTVRAWLEGIAEELCTSGGKGCFMVNAAGELGGRDLEATRRAQAGFDDLRRAFATVLDRGRSTGELPTDLDPQAAAAMLTSCALGLRVQGRTGADRATLRRSIDATLRALT